MLKTYENQRKLACVPVDGTAITAAVFLLPVGYKESSPPPTTRQNPYPADGYTSEDLPAKLFKAEEIDSRNRLKVGRLNPKKPLIQRSNDLEYTVVREQSAVTEKHRITTASLFAS